MGERESLYLVGQFEPERLLQAHGQQVMMLILISHSIVLIPHSIQ
jgi:hypothetical protein